MKTELAVRLRAGVAVIEIHDQWPPVLRVNRTALVYTSCSSACHVSLLQFSPEDRWTYPTPAFEGRLINDPDQTKVLIHERASSLDSPTRHAAVHGNLTRSLTVGFHQPLTRNRKTAATA